ncbi:MAG TPA: DUF2336 domain-containing protein [Alphaproteobacteria bacterium]|nr:DUF2336 domain-containing protein [Alphaproteobacteria bacterium]
MASSLSQADVARLLAEPSPHTRAEMAGKLAQNIDNPHLTDKERTLAQDVVRLMAKDVEATVRKALAESLRSAARLPHDVALKLAGDIEEVALPILAHSPVLTDEDLIAIVRQNAGARQEAIAARPQVSEQVADALIEDGGEQAVALLMNNAGAHISDAGFGKAIDRFPHSEAVKANMVQRARLPVTIAERLVILVSERLQEQLVATHELPPALAADLVLQSRERSIINISSGAGGEDVEKLAAQMHAHKRLTPSLVLRALCMGDLVFFEAAVAIMADVPLLNARVLMHDAGRLGLKSLYDKSGLPARFLPAVRIAMDVVRETPMDGEPQDRKRYRARVIERILTQYEDFGSEDLDYLLEKLGALARAAA